MTPSDMTEFERFKTKFLNVPIVAFTVFVAFGLISLSVFIDSIVKLKTNLEELNPIEERKVQFDRVTHEHMLNLAKLVDDFFLRIIEESENNATYNKYANDYRVIEVELRNLLHREKSRPLNSESTKALKKLFSLWVEVKNEHKKVNSMNAAYGSAYDEELYKIFTLALEMVLTKEENKLHSNTN